MILYYIIYYRGVAFRFHPVSVHSGFGLCRVVLFRFPPLSGSFRFGSCNSVCIPFHSGSWFVCVSVYSVTLRYTIHMHLCIPFHSGCRLIIWRSAPCLFMLNSLLAASMQLWAGDFIWPLDSSIRCLLDIVFPFRFIPVRGQNWSFRFIPVRRNSRLIPVHSGSFRRYVVATQSSWHGILFVACTVSFQVSVLGPHLVTVSGKIGFPNWYDIEMRRPWYIYSKFSFVLLSIGGTLEDPWWPG